MGKQAACHLTIGFDAKRALRNNTGLGNYSRYVINSLADAYHDCRLILLSGGEIDPTKSASLISKSNVSLFAPKGLWGRKMPAWWRTWGMARDWSELGLDLYHGLSNEIPLTSKRGGCSTVVTIHDLIWRRYPADYHAVDRAMYEYKYRSSARIADRVIAISERTKADLVSDWKIDPEKIDVIYQGCNPVFSKSVGNEDRKRILNKYNLPERYIVSVGTVQGRKNQMLAVKALSGLPDDIKLVVAGRWDSAYGRELQDYIDRNGLGNRIVRLESVPFDELPALYAGALFSSYTSRYEGFGIPVIESINAGTPVIACSGSCLEEAGGPGALYVDSDDVEGYVEAARAIIDNRLLRNRLLNEGKSYVERFNQADFAKAMMRTYEKALNEFNKQKQCSRRKHY